MRAYSTLPKTLAQAGSTSRHAAASSTVSTLSRAIGTPVLSAGSGHSASSEHRHSTGQVLRAVALVRGDGQDPLRQVLAPRRRLRPQLPVYGCVNIRGNKLRTNRVTHRGGSAEQDRVERAMIGRPI